MVLLFSLAVNVYFKYFGEELEYPSGIQITRQRERLLNIGFSVYFSGISAAKAGLWYKHHCSGYHRTTTDSALNLLLNLRRGILSVAVSQFPSTFKIFYFWVIL